MDWPAVRGGVTPIIVRLDLKEQTNSEILFTICLALGSLGFEF
jgi:hypothetical protein